MPQLMWIVGLIMILLAGGGCGSNPFHFRSAEPDVKDEVQVAQEMFERGSYDEAIQILNRVLEQPSGRANYEAHWLLAQIHEAKGNVQTAFSEYQQVRSDFPQTAHGTEALQKMRLLQPRLPAPIEPIQLVPAKPRQDYRLGEEDEIDITVYGDSELSKKQTVRPDGRIAFPLIGDLKAARLTPDELREQITERLSKFVRNPRVTVIVSQYNSKHVYVLGQVKAPGLVRLGTDLTVLQSIARAGGVTDDADLQGALLVRDSQILPVNFERLFRNGDFSHNVVLHSNDTILVPNVSARKIFVLGEVKQPTAIPLRHPISLIESISMAGGLTIEGQPKSIAIIKGGLSSRNMITVNIDDITRDGLAAKNLMLEPNDIVYVPTSFIADADRFLNHAIKLVSSVVLAEFGVALYPTVKSVLTTGKATENAPTLIPQPRVP
jgi:polysaccharide export outer membrane protein